MIEDILSVLCALVCLMGVPSIILAAVVGGILLAARQRRQWSDDLRRVAARFDGVLREGELFTAPTLRFTHREFPALLDYHHTGGRHAQWYTRLQLPWADRALRCTVRPEGILASVGKLLGMTDVTIGSPRFDAEYVINGRDPRELRALLTPAVQQLIERLRRFGSGDIYLEIQGGRFLVKKRGRLQEANSVIHFLTLALELYDSARGAAVAGIEFVEAGPAEEKFAGAICQVCGEGIERDPVLCRGCRTPHHADCWDYFGRCSVYGCGGTRIARPASAAALEGEAPPRRGFPWGGRP